MITINEEEYKVSEGRHLDKLEKIFKSYGFKKEPNMYVLEYKHNAPGQGSYGARIALFPIPAISAVVKEPYFVVNLGQDLDKKLREKIFNDLSSKFTVADTWVAGYYNKSFSIGSDEEFKKIASMANRILSGIRMSLYKRDKRTVTGRKDV